MSMKNDTTLKKLTIATAAMLTGCLTIFNVLAPKTDFSANENRYLAPFPSLAPSNVFSGNFDEQFESWFSDHFIRRDQWIRTKADMRRDVGAIENNGIYLCKNKQLIQSFTNLDQDNLNNNISYVNEFNDELKQKVNVMIVPSAAWGDSENLPAGAYNLNEKKIIESIKAKMPDVNFLDLSDDMTAEENLYFRTDHHWNEKGAYLGYEKICEDVLDKEPEKFSYEKVSDDFKGTLYSKSGCFDLSGDPLYKIVPENDNQVTLELEDGTVLHSLYVDKNLEIKDKYTYYLDGNHAYEKITTSVDNGKKALIIKDSYAHILVPYLAQECSEIQLVDLRSYRQAASDLVDDDTDVYILYSLNEFAAGKNLAALW